MRRVNAKSYSYLYPRLTQVPPTAESCSVPFRFENYYYICSVYSTNKGTLKVKMQCLKMVKNHLQYVNYDRCDIVNRLREVEFQEE